MNVLIIGDVVGKIGVDMVKKVLPNLIKQYNIDFTVVNGENSADGMGITKSIFHDLRGSGADVITMGNHTWGKKEIFSFIDDEPRLIRPSNYAEGLPGNGNVLVDCKNHKIGYYSDSMPKSYLPLLGEGGKRSLTDEVIVF